jgi:hypothetical protein
MIDLEKVVLQQCLRHCLPGGRSENQGGEASDNLPSLVGIGLTDKYGGNYAPAPPCSAGSDFPYVT